MVLNYYGVDITQEDIVYRSYGVDPSTGYLPDFPGDFQTLYDNLNNWSFDRRGYQYSVHAVTYHYAPTPQELGQSITENIPIILSIPVAPGFLHSVVITGVGFLQDYSGIRTIHTVIVFDPAPPPDGGKFEYNANSFLSSAIDHWRVLVTFDH
jgi:hypothetical protein